jgi:hypothetical protein
MPALLVIQTLSGAAIDVLENRKRGAGLIRAHVPGGGAGGRGGRGGGGLGLGLRGVGKFTSARAIGSCRRGGGCRPSGPARQ